MCWNGIYIGTIDRVNDDPSTYKIAFDDNTVEDSVDEEHIFEYVESWKVGEKVVVILDNWDDNFMVIEHDQYPQAPGPANG